MDAKAAMTAPGRKERLLIFGSIFLGKHLYCELFQTKMLSEMAVFVGGGDGSPVSRALSRE
jgi:hypothetical protein